MVVMRDSKFLTPKNILVLGDLVLDRYTLGEVERISPEAPVPVLLVKEQKSLPGGAGNVALNLCSLGMRVKIMGRLGNDEAATDFIDLMERDGVETKQILSDSSIPTPVKNRMIAGGASTLAGR